MNILSLYDGMSCGMIAMMLAGVEVDRYVAYEIDKYAVKTSLHNFPQIEQMGDVFEGDFTQYQGFDFLVGGSPCTYWSIAQKNNRETEASGLGWELFSQYVRALHEAKPKFFIYENNKSMSKAIRDSIRETFGFEEICINSALVSAQNRQRYYWVGKRNEDGTYSKVDVKQPEDRGILLKDVLDKAAPFADTFGKSFAITSGYCAGVEPDRSLAHHQRTCVAESVTILKAIPEIVEKYGYLPEMFNAYNRAEITDKAPTLSTGSMVTSSCAVNKFEKVAEARNAPKAILPVEGYAPSNFRVYAIVSEFDENGAPVKAISGADGKEYTVYTVKDGQITIKGKTYPIKLADGFWIIRKLTVFECMRLQTVPDWYDFSCVSNTQAYKMLGNGWTCEVITHLIKACLCYA